MFVFSFNSATLADNEETKLKEHHLRFESQDEPMESQGFEVLGPESSISDTKHQVGFISLLQGFKLLCQ